MGIRTWFFALAAALATACATEIEPLNSERIASAFGSYGIDVLSFDNGVRRANLYSGDNGNRICRTYAIVRFATPIDPEISVLHQQVLNGASIGQTYKAAGFTVSKIPVWVGELDLGPDPHRIRHLMKIARDQQVAASAYQLAIKNDSHAIEYAEVYEIHHPDYLGLAELRQQFDELPDGDTRAAAADTLQQLIGSTRTHAPLH